MGSSQSVLNFKPEMTAVELHINDKPYTVPDNLLADTSLNTFIREHAHLTGTKFMCLEGGCGTCIVSVKSTNPVDGNEKLYSVNSCLVPVYACNGWSVTTAEGLGNKRKGYHNVQKKLAAASGTQCGYCSSGMVMNMNSLLEGNPKITMKSVENSFGGNICRCTGYRPILDAFKSLASDASPELVRKITDIEDLICPKNGTVCSGHHARQSCIDCNQVDWPSSSCSSLFVKLKDGTNWLKPTTVKEIFEIFDQIGDQTYRLVAGNTGQGVFRWKQQFQNMIDINAIPELHTYEIGAGVLRLGANMSLTDTMALFNKLAVDRPHQFSYLRDLADHIDLVANVPVRNIGTLAGNLSMKHSHSEFPSDIFLILEMANAHVVIDEKTGMEKEMQLMEYLDKDMKFKVITKIILPTYNSSTLVRSFKIMPRAQNTHAYVNAGFLVKVDKKDLTVLDKPRLIFGGIRPGFVHAAKTEAFLQGKKLLDPSVLQGALTILENEINPDHVLPDATPQYRKGLAVSLFYKFILSVNPSRVDDFYKSGGLLLERPLSSGKQTYETDPKLWPLNKPIPKLEAFMQCSGEAEYTNDIPSSPGELWAQIALTDRLATVSKIDPSEALNLPGVWGFYSAKDIPGQNSFMMVNNADILSPEIIFVEEGKTAQYAGQAVGVVLADSRITAMKAADLVKITYTDESKPIMDVWDIVYNGPKERIKLIGEITPSNNKTDVKHEFEGRWNISHQYHFTMETHSCVAIPSEGQLDVYPTSQGLTSIQQSISNALGIPENHINIRVRRLGGGYGSKLTRCNHAAVVTSMSAYLSGRPVRFVLTMEHNMQWAGKRFPVHSYYKVGVNADGAIQYLTAFLYQDNGCSPNDSASAGSLMWMKNLYDFSAWNVKAFEVTTDTASNTWCRAPGSTEGIALIETIMEHIAHGLNKDPVDVRFANVNTSLKDIIQPMVNGMIDSTEYRKRLQDVNTFNKENRWRKRGIAIVPMSYQFEFFSGFHGVVSIYGMDGTVVVSHGAIEMGQGVNTKVAQVVAHALGVDVEFISVKPTYNMISPNDTPTGGSIGSESVSYAVNKCCEQLNKRLEPTKQKLGPDAKWKDIIQAAYGDSVDLMATYQFTTRDDVKNYLIYGVTVAEVEIDLLTGNYIPLRVDILEDAGQSLSPEIDVGQVEGAFIMGMGYYMTEEVVLDPSTGANLTDRTWTYKPPGPKDIPVDFRVTLLKNSRNLTGVLRSKATGEPPLCMSISIPMAVRNAVLAARQDAGATDKWVELDPPFSPEKIWLGSLTKKEQMVLRKKKTTEY